MKNRTHRIMHESGPSGRHRRPLKQSGFEQWLYRLRHSKREKRRFIQLIVIISAVLLAFLFGYFYFGPSFTFSEAS